MPDHKGRTKRNGGFYGAMSHWGEYFTEEHWKLADENNLKPGTVISRLNQYGWKLQKAITQAPRKAKPIPKEWHELAKANGIEYHQFVQRVNRQSWEVERAATTPIMKMEERSERYTKKNPNQRHDPKMIALAESNGISAALYRNRINKGGWTPWQAATTPKVPIDESLRRARANSPIYEQMARLRASMYRGNATANRKDKPNFWISEEEHEARRNHAYSVARGEKRKWETDFEQSEFA